MWDSSSIFELHHSSQQCRILNPLREARDRTHVLMDASWVHWAMTGTLSPHSWGESSYINYLEFFCMGDVSILSKFLYIYIYIIMDSWIFISYTLYHNSILHYVIAQIVPILITGSSSVDSSVPLTYSCHWCLWFVWLGWFLALPYLLAL